MKLLNTFLSLILLCVCSTANADDSWVYPKQSSGIAGNCNLHNESNAIFWSRDIDDDFDTIVNWYARKLAKKRSQTSIPICKKLLQNFSKSIKDFNNCNTQLCNNEMV